MKFFQIGTYRQVGAGWVFAVKGSGVFYFRLWGYGLHITRSRELCFSERMGLRDYVRVGNIIIRGLRP